MPAPSLAFTINVWVPVPCTHTSQLYSNGAVVSADTALPSTRNNTSAISLSSVTSAFTVVVAVSVDWLAGNVIITVGAWATNLTWATQYDIKFPILADFWPHGEVAQKFGCFNEKVGTAMRYSYLTNEENIITEIIKSDEFPIARDFSEYRKSLEL